MASNEPQYNFKSAWTVRGLEARTTAKYEKDGWEFVSKSQESLLRTKLNFRRMKPKRPWYLWGGLVGVLVILGVIIAVNASLAQNDVSEPTPSPTVSAVAPSVLPTAQASEGSLATEAEVVEAFQAFVNERAAANVMLAKTVTDVSFNDRVLRVTFDPSLSGFDQATFDQLITADNYVSFAGTPISFNDDLGIRLRPAIDAIETFRIDGTALGTRTTAEIIALNGLDK